MPNQPSGAAGKVPAVSVFWRLSPQSQLVLALIFGILPMLAFATLFAGPSLVSLAVALGGYSASALLAIGLMRRGYPHSRLGSGNLLTVFRLTVVAALLAPLFGVALPWAVVVVSTLALVLDGVDGWLARRDGLVSSFGGRLDMEVDSALALVLAINVWDAGITGAWIVLLGLPRYLFIAAARFLPWLDKELPPSLSRRVICVVQVASLIGLYAPILPEILVLPVALAVAGLLIWSFGKDIIWLWRSRS